MNDGRSGGESDRNAKQHPRITYYVFPGAPGVRCTLNVREVLFANGIGHWRCWKEFDTVNCPERFGVDSADANGRSFRYDQPVGRTGVFAEPDDRLRGEYGALAKVFAKLSSARDQWLQALEGWNVKTSPFLDEIRAEGRHTEGRAEGRAEDILQVLELRFQEIPEEISAGIRQIHDVSRLSRWLKAAVVSKSLEQFMAEVAHD